VTELLKIGQYLAKNVDKSLVVCFFLPRGVLVVLCDADWR